jgi:hypothetical protein
MIPDCELRPTAVTNIRPEPSMTWVPVYMQTDFVSMNKFVNDARREQLPFD